MIFKKDRFDHIDVFCAQKDASNIFTRSTSTTGVLMNRPFAFQSLFRILLKSELFDQKNKMYLVFCWSFNLSVNIYDNLVPSLGKIWKSLSNFCLYLSKPGNQNCWKNHHKYFFKLFNFRISIAMQTSIITFSNKKMIKLFSIFNKFQRIIQVFVITKKREGENFFDLNILEP